MIACLADIPARSNMAKSPAEIKESLSRHSPLVMINSDGYASKQHRLWSDCSSWSSVTWDYNDCCTCDFVKQTPNPTPKKNLQKQLDQAKYLMNASQKLSIESVNIMQEQHKFAENKVLRGKYVQPLSSSEKVNSVISLTSLISMPAKKNEWMNANNRSFSNCFTFLTRILVGLSLCNRVKPWSSYNSTTWHLKSKCKTRLKSPKIPFQGR